MTRFQLLENLIDNILVHDINIALRNETYVLTRGNGIGTSCPFNSAKQKEKMQILFFVCFRMNDGSIKVDREDGKSSAPQLNQYEVVANAIAYFQEIGIDFAPLRKYCSDDKEFEDLLLHAIINILIPVAFGAKVTVKYRVRGGKKHKYDDISDQYKHALLLIKNMLIRFRLQKMISTSEHFIPQIQDNCYKKIECNYEISFNGKTGFELLFFHSFFSVDFCVPLRVSEYRKRYSDQLKQEERESDFEKLVRGFRRYPPEILSEIDEWAANMSFTEDDPSELRFPLSDQSIPYQELQFSSFDYLTHLDENSVQADYPGVTTHEELEAAIRERAQADLALYRKKCLFRYYRDTTLYIDDILSKLRRIDLKALTSENPTDEKTCISALKCFSIDSNHVFDAIREYREDVIWYTYHLLKKAIWDFSTLNFSGSGGRELGKSIRQHLSRNPVLAKHIKSIDAFVTSEPFASIADEQEKNIGKDGERPERKDTSDNLDEVFAEYEAYEKRVLSHVLADLRRGLLQYLEQLRS